MKRRDFLKIAFTASISLVARRVFPLNLTTASDVGIAVGADYAKAVAKALDLVGGITRFVKPGDIVVVKPNIGFNQPPLYKATTDPVIVREVVHLCFAAGA